MNARPILFTLLVWLLATLSSCDLINPKESLPMYIEVVSPEVLLDSSRNLRSDLGVRDLWVSQGSEFQGAFTKGMVFPVFEGESDMYDIGGGVFVSGISGNRTRYPFWGSIAQEIPFQALDTVRLSPVYRYFPRDTILEYAFEETFEAGQPRFVSNPLTGRIATVPINRVTGDVFEGTYAGVARFTANDSILELVSQDELVLPTSGQSDTWLELTFRNTIPFTVGLSYREPGGTIVGLTEAGVFFDSDEWTTVYVPFTDGIRETGSTRPVFRVWMFANGGGSEGEIRIDYIRLIHFK